MLRIYRHRSTTPIFLFMVLLHGVACTSGPAEGGDPASESLDQVVVPPSDKPLLELDNGKRWVVSPPMLVPIERMHERIAQAAGTPDDSPLDATALADSLFADLDELVSGCTMQGKAHEELHDWLMPHMQLVQDLEKTTDPREARSIIQQLARSADTFDRFFE